MVGKDEPQTNGNVTRVEKMATNSSGPVLLFIEVPIPSAERKFEVMDDEVSCTSMSE
jgi:hypothetical protein